MAQGRSGASPAVVGRGVPAYLLVGILIAALFAGAAVADGNAPLAVVGLLAIPGSVLIHRDPFMAILAWLVLNQFLVEGSGGIERRAYWLVHRGLPLAVVVVVLLKSRLGLTRGSLPRFGLPEALMGGYVAVTALSIVFSSAAPLASGYHAYDRIVSPMLLYVAVRLIGVGTTELRRLIQALALVVAVQASIGILSWVAPQALPAAWLGRLGTRTIGSLGHPNVFGVVMITGGLLVAHRTWSEKGRHTMSGAVLLAVSSAMVFLTFGRANWLAAIPAVIGLLVLYPAPMARALAFATPVVAVVVMAGALGSFGQLAGERFLSSQSSKSAVSRLPVVVASVRMFDTRPVTGFGYGNFDLYDREFQSNLDNLVLADKDHASHNVYLTILAEQGAPGLALFLGAPVVWLFRALRRTKLLPASGLRSRRLAGVLVLALCAHVVVNNFSNMKVVYGLGMWWLTLGVLAALLASPEERGEDAAGPERDPLELLAALEPPALRLDRLAGGRAR
jgi:O-antigen ligase